MNYQYELKPVLPQARRRLVPAVVGFDEDGVLPPSPEEVC